ncbi:MAG TPA: DUF4389 domain-containing protein [Gammaproteobacteria bacterium]|jgi:hypothetical protein|nr:DUF4389 domain-containing protein [Gammaproteobacteria bacterium]HIK77345.1 DUF4389 domain-containing protein [Gammaproteobacteria bacterium]
MEEVMEEIAKKDNYPMRDRLIRVLYVILFTIIFSVCRFVLGCIILIQICFDLIEGKPNHRLKQFSLEFKDYIAEIIAFLTYQTEIKPFPFSDWPSN